MRSKATNTIALAALLTSLMRLVGCGGPDAAEPQVKAPSPVRPLEDSLAEEPRPAAEDERADTAYSPPYPSREELFSPPQSMRSVTRRSSGLEDEAVELLGFVSVDQPKAVLSIDGVVTSLAAGSQKYGIEVISIAPPEVVLQRGRNRWTASLD